eukprot:6631427-Pyramimonas_sp.AAC.1
MPEPLPVGRQPRPKPECLQVETLWPVAKSSAKVHGVARVKFEGGPPASTPAESSAAASSSAGPPGCTAQNKV